MTCCQTLFLRQWPPAVPNFPSQTQFPSSKVSNCVCVYKIPRSYSSPPSPMSSNAAGAVFGLLVGRRSLFFTASFRRCTISMSSGTRPGNERTERGGEHSVSSVRQQHARRGYYTQRTPLHSASCGNPFLTQNFLDGAAWDVTRAEAKHAPWPIVPQALDDEATNTWNIGAVNASGCDCVASLAFPQCHSSPDSPPTKSK